MVDDHRLNHPPRLFAWASALVPVGATTVLVLVPSLVLALRALSRSTIGNSLNLGRTAEILFETTTQAAISTALTLAIGLWPALVVARHQFPGRAWLLSFLTGIFVLPTVVMAAGVQATLPDRFDSGWVPIVIAHVVFNLAVVIRIVGAAPVPLDLEQTARTLGASRAAVARTVTLPLIAPAIAAAAAVVFVLAFTSYGVVRILGGMDASTLEVEIWRETMVFGRTDRGVSLAIVQVIVLSSFALIWMVARRRLQPRTFTPGVPTGASPRALISLIPVVLLLLVPLVALTVGSFRVDGEFRTSAWTSLGETSIRPGLDLGIDPTSALLTSAKIAVVATMIAVVIAVAVAVAMAADRRVGVVADAAAMAPLAVSAVTIGLGILITFDTSPFNWRASPLMVPLGHALVATPFVVRAGLAAMSSVPREQTDSASTLGAGPAHARLTALSPALIPALTTGAGMAMAISLGEFGATSLLSRSGAETLPIVIDRLLSRTGGDFRARGHALAVILTAAVMAATLGVERLVTRSRWWR